MTPHWDYTLHRYGSWVQVTHALHDWEDTVEEKGYLFGKTYDQQLDIVGEDITKVDIAPNRRVAGEMVFEPMGNGVRVTARDESHRLLWGFVGSKGMLEQHPCPVAMYDTLRGLISEELEKRGLPAPQQGDPLAEATRAVARLEATVKWLKDSIQAKKVSKATEERARSIARIALDADRQINLDARTFRGMKSKSESDTFAEEV